MQAFALVEFEQALSLVSKSVAVHFNSTYQVSVTSFSTSLDKLVSIVVWHRQSGCEAIGQQ